PVQAPGNVWIEPGSHVRLEGTMQDGVLVLSDTLTAVTELAPARLAASTSQAPSTETTAVVPFYLSDQTTSGLPPNAADTMTTNSKSLRAYYLEQTYGAIAFETTVFAPVQLTTYAKPVAPADCTDSIDAWAEKARELHPTLDPAAYKHIIYVFPQLSQSVCGWAGIAEVGGSQTWINGSFTVPVIAHELGHNLGITHAAGLTCKSSGAPAPMGDACSIDRQHYSLPQYADPFDAMGNAAVLRQMNMAHKLALGVLPASAIATVTTSGTFHLAPMETLTGSVELLRVPKPGGGTYSVEYRQPLGVFDGQAGPSVAGVLIHTESPDISDPVHRGDSDTALVDMHPDAGSPSTQWQNAAMSVGQVFNDPLRGIAIQNLAQDASGATLAITLPLDTLPPGQPGRLSAVLSGSTVALQWTAAADDRGVVSYVVARDGAPLGSTSAVAFTDSAAPPGATVVYAVSAVDAAGNIGPAVTVGVAIPDTIAPSAPANVTAKLAKDGKVRVSWRAATDNLGVASYRVLRNGTGIAQADVTSYLDRAPRRGSGATVTYSVVAFDLAGNAGPPASATPLRAALLRTLGASHVKVVRVKRRLVRVRGTLSDAQASCRLRIGKGRWRPCNARADGTFSADLPVRGTTPVTLSLRDSLGRVKLQMLRVR
ncbi:MAG: hypothetical protein QOE87_1038, partial [Gaiellales bacterium]|nr:hypothetical protein [Gaiellales bacterium]